MGSNLYISCVIFKNEGINSLRQRSALLNPIQSRIKQDKVTRCSGIKKTICRGSQEICAIFSFIAHLWLHGEFSFLSAGLLFPQSSGDTSTKRGDYLLHPINKILLTQTYYTHGKNSATPFLMYFNGSSSALLTILIHSCINSSMTAQKSFFFLNIARRCSVYK